MRLSIFDVLLHPSLNQGDPDAIRRARTTAAFLGVSGCGAVLMCPLMFAVGDTTAGVTTLVSVVLIAVPLVLLRFRAMRELAAHAMLVNTALSLMPAVVSQGGLGGPAADWFALLPLLATLMLSRRTAAWLAITVAILGTFGALHLTGVLPPAAPTREAELRLVISQLFVVGCTYLLARTFERNRSGMERALERARIAAVRAHATAQGVLDGTDQGLFIVAADGKVGASISRAAIRWFGAPAPGATAWAWLREVDETFATWLELGVAAHRERLLPAELTLAQLPQRLRQRERSYAVRWLPGTEEGELLAVVTDVTDVLVAEDAEREQREVVALLAHSIRDRPGVLEFLAEADAIVAALAEPTGDGGDARRVHTLKGNAGLFGLATLAEQCHAIEGRMTERYGVLEQDDRRALAAAWTALRTRIDPLIGRERSGTVSIPQDEIEIVIDAIHAGREPDELEMMMRRWTCEPMAVRLARIAEHARALAVRLDKGPIDVHVADHGVALSPEVWSAFWSAFVHVVRNAVDHGLEPPAQRLQQGKPERGGLWLSTTISDELVIAIRDDGRGIDWDAVRRGAAARGLPHASAKDLEHALFDAGFSTKEVATAISGRGVGLGAIAEETRKLGGRIVVRTELGVGTTFELRFPTRVAYATEPSFAHAA